MLLEWLDENQAVDNRIIPPYVTGTLKSLMHVIYIFKHSMFDPKNWITSSMTINITVCFLYTRNNFLPPYILKAEQGFLGGVYTVI